MQVACSRFSPTWNNRRPHDIHSSWSFWKRIPLSFSSRGRVLCLLLCLPCHFLPTLPWVWCFGPVPAEFVFFAPSIIPWCSSGPSLLLMWWRLHIHWLQGGSPPGCCYIWPIDWWEILLLPWWLLCPCCSQPCFAHCHDEDSEWSYSPFQSSDDEPSWCSRTTCTLCRVPRKRCLLSPMFFPLPLSPPTW